jgi:beta-lactamase superfamily II metal-dependent hydrolase
VDAFIRHHGRATDVLVMAPVHDVLSVDFVDVQQGDAAVVESPSGAVMLIDGGSNQLFARYLANRFPGTSATAPRKVDAIVVTHGDADHFAGLTEIKKSETNTTFRKRIFIRPERIYHNGLVKRPKKIAERASLGPTMSVGAETYLTGLVDDITGNPPPEQMNRDFRAWRTALLEYASRAPAGQPMELRRLERGSPGAFGFLAGDDVDVRVLGPAVVSIDPGGGAPPVAALRFLHEAVEHASETIEDPSKNLSASHTINGHSVVLAMTYGKCRYLFTGDLNAESESTLKTLHDANQLDLEADVLKVPHHGSADFSADFIGRVKPLVSVVSSGDESAFVEYIHPRATLVAALGRASRVAQPLVFITELVAFFGVEGYVAPDYHSMTPAGIAAVKKRRKVVDVPNRKAFYSFSRAAFGTVRTRTDGKRLLVWTDSALARMKEAYVFDLQTTPPTLESIDPV